MPIYQKRTSAAGGVELHAGPNCGFVVDASGYFTAAASSTSTFLGSVVFGATAAAQWVAGSTVAGTTAIASSLTFTGAAATLAINPQHTTFNGTDVTIVAGTKLYIGASATLEVQGSGTIVVDSTGILTVQAGSTFNIASPMLRTAADLPSGTAAYSALRSGAGPSSTGNVVSSAWDVMSYTGTVGTVTNTLDAPTFAYEFKVVWSATATGELTFKNAGGTVVYNVIFATAKGMIILAFNPVTADWYHN